jgi:NAD(P)-dependent dehydrogenase (short-subunit alcohol dehydrogenase family)
LAGRHRHQPDRHPELLPGGRGEHGRIGWRRDRQHGLGDGRDRVPGLVGYAARKGGVIQVTRALAVEFAANGIRVNAVAPSTFDTPLALGNRALRPEVYERLRQRTPLGRFGQVAEVVGPVLFLLSKAASMVTGHVLAVDGGYLAS